jgi:hypothetical protein
VRDAITVLAWPVALLGMVLAAAPYPAAADPALQLEAKIPLGQVSGRIDHMAIDLGRQRLLIAELGNDSLAVVDLKAGRLERRIGELSEPQGVGYAARTDTVYVANAHDGSVRLFQGDGLVSAGRIDLGADADNIRIDASGAQVVIGHGGGALALIDPSTRAKLADIPLKAHPEGFQLDPAGDRVFVNLPEARQIAVVDRRARRQVASWQVPRAQSNFPMAIDGEQGRLLAVYRSPSLLAVLALRDGSLLASPATCGDADDVFVDSRRHRAYVSCGQGFIDVFDLTGAGYPRIDRVATAAGARTSLFVPERDRLYLAVRAGGAEQASVWVFRPLP